jgi:hypothetical protein
MTVLDDVRGFVERRAPQATCDDCIAGHLRLSVRQHANHKTRELATGRGFDRRKGRCSICGAEKLVIRLAGPACLARGGSRGAISSAH